MSAAPPPPPPPPNFGPPPGGMPAPQAGTNGLAIASLILSVVGFFCGIGSIIGIILGFIARGQIKQTGQGGAGLATAGIIIGFVTIVLSILFYIWVSGQSFS